MVLGDKLKNIIHQKIVLIKNIFKMSESFFAKFGLQKLRTLRAWFKGNRLVLRLSLKQGCNDYKERSSKPHYFLLSESKSTQESLRNHCRQLWGRYLGDSWIESYKEPQVEEIFHPI